MSEGTTPVAEGYLKRIDEAIGTVSAKIAENEKAIESNTRSLKNEFDGLKLSSGESAGKLNEAIAAQTELRREIQSQGDTLRALKRSLDDPIAQGGSVLKESDKKANYTLQRESHLRVHPDAVGFKYDGSKAVDMNHLRSAISAFSMIGIKDKAQIVAGLSAEEKRAVELSGIDAQFFPAEVLGMAEDCEDLCADITDLYDLFNVNRPSFKLPKVTDYGKFGNWTCANACEEPLTGGAGMTMTSGEVNTWRAMFCLSTNDINSASVDLPFIMTNNTMRALRLEVNRSMMVGSGADGQPLGWLTASQDGKCFEKVKSTKAGTIDHVMVRQFGLGTPMKQGKMTAIMHQNVLAFLASQTDKNGRFIFGDNELLIAPDSIPNIRISNCLPDATNGMTLGNPGATPPAPFLPGAFLMAVGDFKAAFAKVVHRNLTAKFSGENNTSFCAKWGYEASIGSHVKCCDAIRILISA
jgi:hypothetical protein